MDAGGSLFEATLLHLLRLPVACRPPVNGAAVPHRGDSAEAGKIETMQAALQMSKLRINVTFPRIVFVPAARNPRGTEYDKSVHGVLVCSKLVHPKGSLSFNCVVSVPKSLAAEERRAKQLALSWLGANLARQMSGAGRWDFFRPRDLHVHSSEGLESNDEGGAIEQDLVTSTSLEAEVVESLSVLADVESKFDAARLRLEDVVSNSTALGFLMSLAEARQLIRGVEQVLQAGNDSGRSTASDARSAVRDYEELARRKQEENANYKRALSSLRSFVYGLTFPTTWKERPRWPVGL